MDHIQQIQEDEYAFPYHYLPHETNSTFGQHRDLFWGYEYWGYITFIVDLIATLSYDSLLDVGCGDGRLLNLIAETYPNKILVGIDYSPKALGFANAFKNGPTPEFLHADIHSLAADNRQFDIVTSIEVIEHIPPASLKTFLDAHVQVLRPGGLFVITTPTTNIPTSRKHYQHFTKEVILSALPPSVVIEQEHYLNIRSFGVKLIERIFGNRFFILNSAVLRRLLYRQYTMRYLKGTNTTGSRICLVLRKRPETI